MAARRPAVWTMPLMKKSERGGQHCDVRGWEAGARRGKTTDLEVIENIVPVVQGSYVKAETELCCCPPWLESACDEPGHVASPTVSDNNSECIRQELLSSVSSSAILRSQGASNRSVERDVQA